jgi:hypothetical protein
MDSERALSPEEVVTIYPALTRSMGTLANWRSRKRGPKFYKLSRAGRVVYKARDIEDFLFRNPILTSDCVD